MKETSFRDTSFMADGNLDYLDSLEKYFQEGGDDVLVKLENFPKYIDRSTLTRFLVRYEIFKKVLDVQGVVVECGVLFGGGLMTWAQLSSILEPTNHQRKIIGFDTFSGFPSVSNEDVNLKTSCLCNVGGMFADSYEDLKECIKVYNMTRYFNHIEKVELVRGDIIETVPDYIQKNSHLIVSLLYMDVDIFKPTSVALKCIVPRMPKGAIIAFDELNRPEWPGETQAVFKELGVCGTNINNLKIKKLGQFGTSISYMEIE